MESAAIVALLVKSAPLDDASFPVNKVLPNAVAFVSTFKSIVKTVVLVAIVAPLVKFVLVPSANFPANKVLVNAVMSASTSNPI